MKDSELRTRAKSLALKVISVCDEIDTRKGRGVLVNQITRSATSIGANIYEANYAHVTPDFIAKLQIALKECYETDYWIQVFAKSEIIDRDTAKTVYNHCGTIRRMLISSINTAKGNNK